MERQKASLKQRLQTALEIAKAPQTSIDTTTVADKAVRLLDIMLEVGSAIAHNNGIPPPSPFPPNTHPPTHNA